MLLWLLGFALAVWCGRHPAGALPWRRAPPTYVLKGGYLVKTCSAVLQTVTNFVSVAIRFCCNSLLLQPPSLLTLRLALYGRLGISYGDGRKLPLAIMVSDDTRDRTQEMLEQEQWFGMEEGQVTLMKQEKVAAIQVRIEGMIRPERRHCCPSSCRVGVHPENRSGISISLALSPAFR